jgi:hypothetical protein
LNANDATTRVPEHPLGWYGGGGTGASVALSVDRLGLIAVPLAMGSTATTIAEGLCSAAALTATSSGDDQFAQCGVAVTVAALLGAEHVKVRVAMDNDGDGVLWMVVLRALGRTERVDVREPLAPAVGEGDESSDGDPAVLDAVGERLRGMVLVIDRRVADRLLEDAQKVRLGEAGARVGEALRDGVVVQLCLPSTRTTAPAFHGTSQRECPSKTPSKNAQLPRDVTTLGHEAYAVALRVRQSTRTSAGAFTGTNHSDSPSYTPLR